MTTDLLTTLVAIMTVIVTGLVPWAYTVGARLAAIESELKSLSKSAQPPEWLKRDVDRCREEIHEMRGDIHKIQLWCQSRTETTDGE